MRYYLVTGLVLVGLITAMAALPSAALAFAAKSDKFQAVEAKAPIALDGKVAGSEWQAGLVAKDFFNFTTRQPSVRDMSTTAYLLYDANYLYIGFACDQGTAPITANQTTNGVGEDLDDEVEINIDPSGNGTRTYTFKTTPRGTRYQSSSESNRFNPLWHSAASVQAGAWTAEMAIPLKALRASGSQAWGINRLHYAAKVPS